MMERARAFAQSVEPPVLWSVFQEAWRKVASIPGDLVDVLITTATAGVLTGVFGSRWGQPDNSASLVDCASAPNAGTFEERRKAYPTPRPSLSQSWSAVHGAPSTQLQLGNRMHDLPGMFAHRENSPDSFDSICLRCYRTVGTRTRESDLSLDEENHVCRETWQRSSHIANRDTQK